MSRMDERAAELFDLLASAAPGSVSRDQLMTSLGIRHVSDFHTLKGHLQDQLGAGAEEDENPITVVGESPGDGGGAVGWTYSLTQDSTGLPFRAYLSYKEQRIFSQQARAWMVVNAICVATKADTPEGRIVRKQRRSIARALEDSLDAMSELGITALPVLPWLVK